MQRHFKVTLCLLLGLLPLGANAGPDNLPIAADARWYVHANLLEMRQTVAGQHLYRWFEDEVLREIQEEIGIDLAGELDGVTVFGSGQPHTDAAVVLHGFLSTDTREIILARLNAETEVVTQSAFGHPFYRIGERASTGSKHHGHDFDGAQLAFGDLGQTLVTEDETLMQTFLANGAHFPGSAPVGLIVIQAEHPLLQGGMDAAELHLEGGPWESEMFRNVEQAALTIADDNGLVAIRAEVVALTPSMAEAIRNIVQGVVSLQALANEDPEAAELLSQLRVSTDGAVVRMAVSLAPERIIEFLD